MMSRDAHRRRKAEPSAEQTFADLLNGFTLDSGRRKGRRDEPEQPPEADHPVYPAHFQDDADTEFAGEESASIVRAYSWTGGRTTSSLQLEIETLVTVAEWDWRAGPVLKAEYHDVVELCGQPRSVAEVAALLRLPLGVARVLLGDMAERGLIDVHRTVASDGDVPGLGLMERVLSGLRRL
jgi:hypothetical protein